MFKFIPRYTPIPKRLLCLSSGWKSFSSALKGTFKKRSKTSAVSTAVTLHVLGTGANELSPSFRIACDEQHYIFNCSELVVRSLDKVLKILRNDPLFIFTRACWESMSSVWSLHFMLASIPHDCLDYCGPLGCTTFFDLIMSFCGGKSWRRITHHDGKLKISVIDLQLPGNHKYNIAAYHCKMVDRPGKFNPEKASSLGVPRGPLFGILQRGESVTTKSGTVNPSQVMENTVRGSSILVVESPDEAAMDAVCSDSRLSAKWFGEEGDVVSLLVHLTPLHILQNRKYCDWMKSFGPGANHLFLHSSVCPAEVSLRESVSLCAPFHLTDPDVFRFPHIPATKDPVKLNAENFMNKESLIIGQTGLIYNVFPKNCPDFSKTLPPLKTHIEDTLKEKGIFRAIQSYNRKASVTPPWNQDNVISYLMSNKDPAPLVDASDCRVTMLGTSSMYSTPTRNVSGILLETLKDGNVLLDCGEGTLSQLYRCFGTSYARNVLRNLQLIFISHLHPDHVLGLFRLLDEIASLGDPKPAVTIIAPAQLMYELERAHFEHQLIHSGRITREPYSLGGLSFQAVTVKHIRRSYGVVLRRGDDWSIVYSGDTGFCPNLIKEGENATLLIHEATYLPRFIQLQDLHFIQTHTSYEEAITVAKQMKAKFTILTHFSPSFSFFGLEEDKWIPAVLPGMDFASVRLSDIQKNKIDSLKFGKLYKHIFPDHTFG